MARPLNYAVMDWDAGRSPAAVDVGLAAMFVQFSDLAMAGRLCANTGRMGKPDQCSGHLRRYTKANARLRLASRAMRSVDLPKRLTQIAQAAGHRGPSAPIRMVAQRR